MGGRDALLWPFSRDSIWNLPIGSGAVYVWAGIRHATAMSYFTDADILVLEPSAPVTTVYANYDDWGGGNRCSAQGGAIFSAPIPANFVVPGSHQGSPDGDTPNAATAVLAADGHTIIQTQPFARCAGSAPTSHYMFGSEDLYGTGETGSHGGSGLSALGGTVRLGELVPGGAIRHAMKLNIDSSNFYPGFGGYRWPAWKSDAGGAGYSGSIPEARMGSLLAPRSDFAISSLETEPGRIVAQAFRDYGAYIVDSSGWSIYNFVTERSPRGAVQDEFQQVWGYSLNVNVGANGWARDLDKIFTNLYVVNNWDQGTWQTVSASAGSLGVGLGAPLAAWAPDFGQSSSDTTAPVSTAAATGTSGPANWFASPVTVTISATDTGGSGLGSIHVRTDGGSWQTYSSPVTVSADGSHAVDYYATDVAGNNEASRSITFKIDTVGPVSSAALSGTAGLSSWYRSSVQVTVSASDAGSGVSAIHVRSDGGSYATYTSPLTISASGSHTVDYYATDVVAHDGAVRTSTFGIDAVAPVSTMALDSAPDGNGAFASPVHVTLSSTDATSGIRSVEYRVDSGAWWTYTTAFPLAGAGTHLLEYRSTDVAGNVESSQSRTLVLLGGTNVLPTGAMSASGTSGANGWYVSQVTVTLTATSGTGGATMIAYSIDSGPWFLYSIPIPVGDGRHTLVYQVSDAAGYLGAIASATINVDTTPPVVAKVAPSGSVMSPDGTVSWTVSDPTSGVDRYEVSVDGGAFQSLGTATSVTQHWAVGSHTVAVRAWDSAGNQGTTSIPFQVDASGGPTQPQPIPVSPLESMPPGSLYLAIGFILVSVGLLLLNRQKMDLDYQRRLRARAMSASRSRR